MSAEGNGKDLFPPDNTGVRDAHGRFLPRVSGNPQGRPAGSRNKAAALLEGRLDAEWQEVADGLLAAAKGGNAAAARAVLDRVAPRPRGRSVFLQLPRVERIEDVDAALDIVLAAVGDGAVTPQEAATVAGILDAKRRVLESRALDDRVAALEEKLAGAPLH